MRRFTPVLSAALVVLVLSTGCTAGSEPDGSAADPGTAQPGTGPDAQAEAELEPRTFVADEAIPVTLTMVATDDGGRRTAYFAGYRPDVAFEGAEPVTCAFGVPEGADEFAPGETGDLEISCTEDVTVEPDGLGFTVVEGGREVGAGEIRLAEAS